MRRTQLYLDDDSWNVLHRCARSQGTTISDLVRQAVRERYLRKVDHREEAMSAFVGIRKNRTNKVDAVEYIRSLRRGDRIERLG